MDTDLDNVARFYKAWSEPFRLRLLAILAKHKEVCVCDLVDCLNVNQSVVSRHLNYLKQTDMVKVTRRANWRYYRLSEPLLQHAGFAALLKELCTQQQIVEDLQVFTATDNSCS